MNRRLADVPSSAVTAPGNSVENFRSVHRGAGPPRRARQRHWHSVVPQSRLPPRPGRAPSERNLLASFWTAKASQPFTSRPASLSCATSTGTCSRLHDGATINRRVATTRRHVAASPSAARRSVRHTLRPSTRPSDSHRSDRHRRDDRIQFRYAAHKIDVQPGDRQPGGHGKIVTERAEIAWQQNVRCWTLRGEGAVCQYQARPSPSPSDRAPARVHPSGPSWPRSRPVRSYT